MPKARAAQTVGTWASRGIAVGAVVGYALGIGMGGWAAAIGPVLGLLTAGVLGAVLDARRRIIDLSAHATVVTLPPVHCAADRGAGACADDGTDDRDDSWEHVAVARADPGADRRGAWPRTVVVTVA